MRAIAIIPARGGSRGIPAKNLQPVGGVPLVGRAIRCAQEAQTIEAVYVSTDSPAIARVAREYGAAVIERPAELATDEAPTLPVIQHALASIEPAPSICVVLQCTSPLTRGVDIDMAVTQLVTDDKIDGVISVEEDDGFVFSRSGFPLTYTEKQLGKRRQERPARVRANGALRALRTPVRTTWPERWGQLRMPAWRSIDIDTPLDLQIAEAALRWGQSWIVLGAGPDARENLAAARGLFPAANIITTNAGILLFEPPDRPDVYLLFDGPSCATYHQRALAAGELGTHLVTARRSEMALRARGVDSFDEFIAIENTEAFRRGGYSAVLSGLLCLQYALNHDAAAVHLVGMNGYTGAHGGDYFDGHEPINGGEKRRRHTREIIEPFINRAIEAYAEVEFRFWGKLNYQLPALPNIRHMEVPSCCSSLPATW